MEKFVRLKHPIKLGDELVEQLTFRRGTLGDLDGLTITAGLPSVNDLILIASRLCGKAPGVLKRLDEEDAYEVLEVAASFFGRCLRGGAEG